jgi:tetratricopeptide (TPR) repeat protein
VEGFDAPFDLTPEKPAPPPGADAKPPAQIVIRVDTPDHVGLPELVAWAAFTLALLATMFTAGLDGRLVPILLSSGACLASLVLAYLLRPAESRLVLDVAGNTVVREDECRLVIWATPEASLDQIVSVRAIGGRDDLDAEVYRFWLLAVLSDGRSLRLTDPVKAVGSPEVAAGSRGVVELLELAGRIGAACGVAVEPPRLVDETIGAQRRIGALPERPRLAPGSGPPIQRTPATPATEMARHMLHSGIALLKRDRPEGAARLFLELAHRYPSSDVADNAHYNLGKIYESQGSPHAARLEHELVVNLFPFEDAALFARDHLEELPPPADTAAGLAVVAETLRRTGPPASVAFTYERLLVQYPKTPIRPRVLLELGLTRWYEGSGEEARQWFARLREEHPDSFEARIVSGWPG